MTNPIQFDQLLERVSGNREFIIQMLDMFFESGDERLATLSKAFDNRNYTELADQAHKLKGLVGNLSINQAMPVLKELTESAQQENDLHIIKLLAELGRIIAEARIYYREHPTLTP